MPAEPIFTPKSDVTGVISSLQRGVSLHLTAIENYQAQSAHFGRWGYSKLAEKYANDVEEERGHLQKLLERLEYYDVQPTYEHDSPSWPRHDYEGILEANYELETAAAEAEKAAILVCRSVGDEQSAKVFAKNLKGSDDSIGEIEAIQRVLGQIGVDNYLANQV
jgi:bacterioferritin